MWRRRGARLLALAALVFGAAATQLEGELEELREGWLAAGEFAAAELGLDPAAYGPAWADAVAAVGAAAHAAAEVSTLLAEQGDTSNGRSAQERATLGDAARHAAGAFAADANATVATWASPKWTAGRESWWASRASTCGNGTGGVCLAECADGAADAHAWGVVLANLRLQLAAPDSVPGAFSAAADAATSRALRVANGCGPGCAAASAWHDGMTLARAGLAARTSSALALVGGVLGDLASEEDGLAAARLDAGFAAAAAGLAAAREAVVAAVNATLAAAGPGYGALECARGQLLARGLSGARLDLCARHARLAQAELLSLGAVVGAGDARERTSPCAPCDDACAAILAAAAVAEPPAEWPLPEQGAAWARNAAGAIATADAAPLFVPAASSGRQAALLRDVQPAARRTSATQQHMASRFERSAAVRGLSSDPPSLAEGCVAPGWFLGPGGACEECGAGRYCTGDGLARECRNAPGDGSAEYRGTGGTSAQCPFWCTVSGRYRDREWCVPAPTGFYSANGSEALLPCRLEAGAFPGGEAPPVVFESGGRVTGNASSCALSFVFASAQLPGAGTGVPRASRLCAAGAGTSADGMNATVVASVRRAASTAPDGRARSVALVGQRNAWRLVLSAAPNATSFSLHLETPALRAAASGVVPPRSESFSLPENRTNARAVPVAAVLRGESVSFYVDGEGAGTGWLPADARGCAATSGGSSTNAGLQLHEWFAGGETIAFGVTPFEPAALEHAWEGAVDYVAFTAGVALEARETALPAGPAGLLRQLASGGAAPGTMAPPIPAWYTELSPPPSCPSGSYSASEHAAACVVCPGGAHWSVSPRTALADCRCGEAGAVPDDGAACPVAGASAVPAGLAPTAAGGVRDGQTYERPLALTIEPPPGAVTLRVEVARAQAAGAAAAAPVLDTYVVRGGGGLALSLNESAEVRATADTAGLRPSPPLVLALGVAARLAAPDATPPSGTALGAPASVLLRGGSQPRGSELTAEEAATARIHYTVDGSEPGPDSLSVPAFPGGLAAVGPGVTLRARCFPAAAAAAGLTSSAETVALYPLAEAPAGSAAPPAAAPTSTNAGSSSFCGDGVLAWSCAGGTLAACAAAAAVATAVWAARRRHRRQAGRKGAGAAAAAASTPALPPAARRRRRKRPAPADDDDTAAAAANHSTGEQHGERQHRQRRRRRRRRRRRPTPEGEVVGPEMPEPAAGVEGYPGTSEV